MSKTTYYSEIIQKLLSEMDFYSDLYNRCLKIQDKKTAEMCIDELNWLEKEYQIYETANKSNRININPKGNKIKKRW